MFRRTVELTLVLALVVLTPVLASCGATPAPASPAPTVAATQPPQTNVPSPTSIPSTPTRQGPTVGGKIVWALADEPDSLDPHVSGMAAAAWVLQNVGDNLLARDPVTGKFVPWLAESWKLSDDGLVWEFTLRKDVKFHDGSPLTAADCAFTLNRVIDPAGKSPIAGLFASIKNVTAPDDYTLRLTLSEPSAPLLKSLSGQGQGMILPKAGVEKLGQQFGRAPIGTGPYKIKEWTTGQSITLERNADYKWGPSFLKGGPYIQTIEYRVIPDAATRLAGLETGEIDYMAIPPKDLERAKGTGKIQILEYLQAGGSPSLLFNCGKAPFDDVRVRQAFLWAVDRPSAIKVVNLGNATEMHLPTSPTMTGWWAEGEKTLGYGFDLAKAKDLMKQAGYTPGADGVLQKGGVSLKVVLHTGVDSRLAEVLVEQYKALGASVSIQSLEWGKVLADVFGGSFELCIFGYLDTEFDLLVAGWGSSAIGGIDLAKANDTELDKLLMATRTTVDPDKRQIAMQEAQKYILDKAVIGPLYAPKVLWAASNRLVGVSLSATTTESWFTSAHVVGD